MLGMRFLPDYRKIFNLKIQKKKLNFYHKLVSFDQVNKISKMMMSKEIKERKVYEKKLEKLDKKMREGLFKEKLVNSSYCFVSFSSLSAISCLLKSLKKDKSSKIKISEFIDEIDINWVNCYKKTGIQFLNIFLTFLIIFILIFFTTPTSFLSIIKN